MFAIGEASKRSGVSIETIRYYEREGIVPKPDRAANGRRVYSEGEVGRLRFIRKCRDFGFGINDAKALLEHSEGVKTDCEAALQVASAHLKTVQQKISELRKLEAALQQMTVNCAAGNPHCPMLEELKSA